MSDEYMEKLCKIKKALVDYTADVVDESLSTINTHELGEVIDVIKDLYQAEKYNYESSYYESLIEPSGKVNKSPYAWDFIHDKTSNTDPREAMNTLREIWESSTPDSKIKMKTDLTKLLEEMVI